MANTIEEAKSSRAACRTCKKKIEKGSLRFGEETANTFDPDGGASYYWHHLKCAAGRMAGSVKAALEAYAGDVPDRDEIEKIHANPPKQKSGSKGFPFADRAPTGRAKCIGCEEPIAKGELRIAIEREIETPMGVTKGAGYLHPACAADHVDDEDFLTKVLGNSELEDADVAAVREALTPA
jgi:hypothetical protein